MKPKIAIVGKPNAGKSTLFNRLINKKKSIVEREPGVTRDRNYGELDLYGIPISLIDTGGIYFGEKVSLLDSIVKQAELAIEEANIIILLMDGKEGLTPSDREIYKILKRSEKPIIYLVNKMDTNEANRNIYEFYSLGIERIFPVSAEHNIGIEEVKREVFNIISSFPYEGVKEDKHSIKIAIIGRPNVGKSSIVNRIIGYERVIAHEEPGTTRDSIDIHFELGGKNYIIIDTAGIRRKSRVEYRLEKYSINRAFRSIRESDISLLIIDAKEGVTDQDLKICQFISKAGKASIIVINKWDLIDTDEEEYNMYVKNRIRSMDYSPLLNVSALKGIGIDNIIKTVDRISGKLNMRINTSELNIFFREIVKRRPARSYRNKEVKIYYTTQVLTNPPTFIIFLNIPEGIDPVYERYIINQIRNKYGFEGLPIRIKLKRRER
jgi:GTP-binding protein